MSRFAISDLPLAGAKKIQRQQLGDSRGYLSRLFCAEELALAGWHKPVAQINQTFTSRAGTVRGLHYQVPPYPEMKQVFCIQGAIWDVIVDVRANSPTFLQWHAETLSAENNAGLIIPEGFAHGFQTLSDEVTLLYCHSEFHHSEAEAGINVLDSQLNIPWPLPITVMSERDKLHPQISPQFAGMIL